MTEKKNTFSNMKKSRKNDISLIVSGLAPTMSHYLRDHNIIRKDDITNRRHNMVVPINHRFMAKSRHL
jgi:hypothetical protein